MITFTLAHLTDVHLGPIAGFTPRYWNLKRLTGYLNWRRGRGSRHQRAVLDRIVSDLCAQAPDHIAVTGDLANIGLPQEHINAFSWLETLGGPEEVTVIPGNHDIYSRIGRDPGTRRWARYMASNVQGARYLDEKPDFPFVRVMGGVALIGLNSAIPTLPLIAWGRVGRLQLEHLEHVLRRLGEAFLFRVVLIHHPPLRDQARITRGLIDAVPLASVLERCGAELVVHGHNHHNMTASLPCASGTVTIIGAPSASLGRLYKEEPLARYNLYRIEGDKPWRVVLIGRGLAEPGGPVIELENRQFILE